MLVHFHCLSGNDTAFGWMDHAPIYNESRPLNYHDLWARGDLLSSGTVKRFCVAWCKEIPGEKKECHGYSCYLQSLLIRELSLDVQKTSES